MENELLNFREKSEKNPENEEYLNRLQDTENELKSKYKTREEGEIIRSKFEKNDNNEKPTKYFFRQERKRGESKQINILVDGNNRTINTKDEIMKEIKRFYAQLYKTETTNIQQITENLKYINQSLSTEDSDKLKFISSIEIEEAATNLDDQDWGQIWGNMICLGPVSLGKDVWAPSASSSYMYSPIKIYNSDLVWNHKW